MSLRRGWIVAVEFSDHIERGSRCPRFVVYGRLAGISRTELMIDSWDYKDVGKPYDSINETRHTIVRGAVHKITRLVPHPENHK